MPQGNPSGYGWLGLKRGKVERQAQRLSLRGGRGARCSGAGRSPSLQRLVETLRPSDNETLQSSSSDQEENSLWQLLEAGRWDGEQKAS